MDWLYIILLCTRTSLLGLFSCLSFCVLFLPPVSALFAVFHGISSFSLFLCWFALPHTRFAGFSHHIFLTAFLFWVLHCSHTPCIYKFVVFFSFFSLLLSFISSLSFFSLFSFLLSATHAHYFSFFLWVYFKTFACFSPFSAFFYRLGQVHGIQNFSYITPPFFSLLLSSPAFL